jgi:hypothetical protein
MAYRERLRRFARNMIPALGWIVLSGGMIWGMLALWFDMSRNRVIAGGLVFAFALACAALLKLLRPIRRAQLAILLLLLMIIIGWNLLPPRNDRNWQPDVARLAHATIAGSRMTIENVRNFDYRSETDFTEHWDTRTYDLDQLRGVDLFISFWGPTLIAHTIASWEFADAPPLAISIETRKEVGESYSALRGFFRQYELYYVVADERDVIRLRTNFRGERVYLYHIRMSVKGARAVLLDYMEEINRLNEKPRWYNALTENCTTTIRHHALHVGEGRPLKWQVLANGYLDELSYSRGVIDTSLPFSEMKQRSEITEKAKSVNAMDDFSAHIRDGLPGGFSAAAPN